MKAKVLTFLVVGVLANVALAQEKTPRPEHPRPDFQRPQWVNLNGAWDFDFDPDGVGEKENWFETGRHKWSQKIVVPFPWESELSGIQKPAYRGVGWYHRKISAPRDWKGKRIVLIFGAVDWAARVWLDGKSIGSHENGYLPFEIEVTDALSDGREHDLVVRAEDRVDPETPTGKQTGWYTPSSGIWQTVYLEARGRQFIEGFQAYPDLKSGTVRIELRVNADKSGAPVLVAAESLKDEFAKVSAPVVGGSASLVIRPLVARLWSPESPHLYDFRLQLLTGPTVLDEIVSYAALREITTGKWGDQPFESVLLNDKPIYIQAALHQSFHPKGIYTYPSDETIQHDLQFARDCGLNSLRVHIKVEEPRFYYWADKLGVLIWYDLPNFSRHTETARKNWEATLRGAVARDFNHPAIFCWVLFNETWGLGGRKGYDVENQGWVRSMYELAKKLDTTRLTEDNSACNYDHVVCDLNTWHFYINDYERARDHIANVVKNTFPGSEFNFVKGLNQGSQPLLNSEYGGISAGLGDQDISYCLHYLTNLLRSHNKIQGFIYTELTDIEWEHNGLANYDRSPKEYGYPTVMGPTSVRDIFNPDFVVLDGPPIRNVKPGETIEVPVSISHYSSREIKSPKLTWWIGGTGRLGQLLAQGDDPREPKGKEPAAKMTRYSVVEQKPLRITLPDTAGLYTLGVALTDGADQRVALNWMWFNAVQAPSPRVEKVNDQTIALRFDPADSIAPSEGGDLVLRGEKAATPNKYIGYGKGRVEYRVTIPKFIDPKTIRSIDLLAEVGAKARDEKLDWPARKKPVDYPQTNAKKFPSQVVVSLNGIEAAKWTLEDDPADERGILSHQKRQQPGSYGYLQRARLSLSEGAAREALERDKAILVALDYGPVEGKPSGGLAVFGETNGAYPVEPTLFLALSQPVAIPTDYDVKAPLTGAPRRANARALLPTVGFGETQWKYTFDKPPAKWMASVFDDSAWKTGRHGFGRAGTPNTTVNTPWQTDDVWLRWKGEFRPLQANAPIWIDYYHDEDIEVYVNGKLLLRRSGHVTDYQTERLSDNQRALFVEGENTIAVHCHQTVGGQFVDVGFFAR
jgi:hypothetical protein